MLLDAQRGASIREAHAERGNAHDYETPEAVMLRRNTSGPFLGEDYCGVSQILAHCWAGKESSRDGGTNKQGKRPAQFL